MLKDALFFKQFGKAFESAGKTIGKGINTAAKEIVKAPLNIKVIE